MFDAAANEAEIDDVRRDAANGRRNRIRKIDALRGALLLPHG